MRGPNGGSIRRLAALILLAGALGAIAAGCGGGGDSSLSKDAYEQQMGEIAQSLTASLSRVGTATTVKGTIAALEKLKAEFAEAANEMDAIDPPDDIETEHKQLATAVRQFGQQLAGIIRRVQGGNRTAVAGVQALPALAKIVGASAKISDKGYDLGGSTS